MGEHAHHATARVGDVVLEPGDVLLYRTAGFVPRWIRIKTWSDVNHVETYVGHGRSFSARAAGVHVFPLRLDGLRYVLRPVRPYDATRAMRWRATVLGQEYDWFGFVAFYVAAWQSSRHKMFCSEAVTRDARAGGVAPFALHVDADRVAPSDLLRSPAYRMLWHAS